MYLFKDPLFGEVFDLSFGVANDGDLSKGNLIERDDARVLEQINGLGELKNDELPAKTGVTELAIICRGSEGVSVNNMNRIRFFGISISTTSYEYEGV